MQLVVRRFHQCLGLKKTILDFGEEGVVVPKLAINRDHPAGPYLGWNHGGRGPAVDHLEWRGVECSLIRRVEAVLHPRKPLKPALWPISGKAMEVNRDDTVGHLE
jgi:hypothetical protein